MSFLYLLSGESKKSNEQWIQEVEKELKDLFDSTFVQHYDHRDSGEEHIDLEYESDILCNNVEDNHNYIVFAKSIGSIVTLKSIYEKEIKPKACIFVGFPVGFITHYNIPYNDWLKSVDCPILFIQKTKDPAYGYSDLVKLVGGISDKFTFQEIPGDNHHYENISELKKFINNFLTKYELLN